MGLKRQGKLSSPVRWMNNMIHWPGQEGERSLPHIWVENLSCYADWWLNFTCFCTILATEKVMQRGSFQRLVGLNYCYHCTKQKEVLYPSHVIASLGKIPRSARVLRRLHRNRIPLSALCHRLCYSYIWWLDINTHHRRTNRACKVKIMNLLSHSYLPILKVLEAVDGDEAINIFCWNFPSYVLVCHCHCCHWWDWGEDTSELDLTLSHLIARNVRSFILFVGTYHLMWPSWSWLMPTLSKRILLLRLPMKVLHPSTSPPVMMSAIWRLPKK